MDLKIDDIEKRKMGVFDLYVSVCDKIENNRKYAETLSRMLRDSEKFIEELELRKKDMLKFLEIEK